MKIKGSGSESGSISRRHGSADPDPHVRVNVMDPQHWVMACAAYLNFCASFPDSSPAPFWPYQSVPRKENATINQMKATNNGKRVNSP
jgi:hypothetical protein